MNWIKRIWKSRNEEWLNRGFVILLGVVLFGVIAMNAAMINRMSKSQTESIGENRLRLISYDLELMLVEAEDNLTLLEKEVESFLATAPDEEALDAYFRERRQELQNKGLQVINVFGIGADWIAIPDFDELETFDPTTRGWYQELMENGGEVTITLPYQDASTGYMCFTISVLMDDGETIVGIDFYLNDIQDMIFELCANEGGEALIVGSDGLIVGYSDNEALTGKSLAETLPEYETVVHHAAGMTEKSDMFTLRMNGNRYTIFCTRTENNWHIIYRISSIALYWDTYMQLLRNSIINVLFVIGILALYIYGNRSRRRAEQALLTKESFLRGLSQSFKEPLARILHMSNYEILDGDSDIKDCMDSIHACGLQISTMYDNLFSYSTLVLSENTKKKSEKKVANRRLYLLVSAIFMIAMLSALVINIALDCKLVKSEVNQEAGGYESVVSEWVQTQETVLSMFVDVVSSQPQFLKDYETTVAFLDAICCNYEDISVAYITNAEWGNGGVRMNNDWHPDETFVLTERQWYVDTIASETGEIISDPYYDAQTELYCVTFSKIIYDADGNFLGVFGIDCYLDKLIGILGDSYSDEGYAFLADAGGNIINHPHSTYEMTEAASTWISESPYAGVKTGTIQILKDYDNSYKICLLMNEVNSGFSIYVVKDLSAVCRPMIPYLLLLIVLFIAGLVIINMLMRKNNAWYEEVTEELKASVSAAEEAGRSKTQFLAQMSHEIRTPINAVLGMNEMICRECEDAQILEYAQNINTAGNTLLSLINNILDFSKLDSNRMEIVPVTFDTLPWIDNLVHMIEDRAKRKGLVFLTEIDEAIPCRLYGDDVRLTQVITNLLTNALKYTDEGSIVLRMRVSAWDDMLESVQLRVSIKDTGSGIREEDREKLFESFGRVNLKETRNVEGTGLGIPIVQKLLVLMGSSLCVDSVYGEGSDFYFEITQRITDRTPIGSYEEWKTSFGQHQMQPESRQHTDYVCVPGARILVVDDNSMNLQVAKGLLRRSKAKVTLCGGGREAVGLLREQQFDLILLDHMMPDMDGIEVLHTAQRERLLPEETAVVVMTANAIAGSREKYLEEGFDGYISKPVRVEELEAALERFLSERYGREADAVSDENKNEEEAKERDAERGYAHEELNILAERLPELNISAGMKYCMDDEEFYLSTCGIYAEENKAEKLRECYAAQDWTQYCIQSHALKSTSFNIGLTGLGEEFLLLESAARENDIEKIKAHHEQTAAHYERLLAVLRSVLPQALEQAFADRGGEALSEEELRLRLEELARYLGDYDVEQAKKLSADLCGHPQRDPERAAALRAVAKDIGNFELDAALEKVEAL